MTLHFTDENDKTRGNRVEEELEKAELQQIESLTQGVRTSEEPKNRVDFELTNEWFIPSSRKKRLLEFSNKNTKANKKRLKTATTGQVINLSTTVCVGGII